MRLPRALHRDLDHGMQPAELRQHGQQVQRRELIRRHHQLALLQFAQLHQRLTGIVAQVQ